MGRVRGRVAAENAGGEAGETTHRGGDFGAGVAGCVIASFIVAAQRCESLLFLLRVFVGIRWWGARGERGRKSMGMRNRNRMRGYIVLANYLKIQT